MRQKLNNFCDEMKHMKTNINKHCTANGLNVNTEFGANMNKQHRSLAGFNSVTTIGLLISALFISGISQAEEAVATDAVKDAVVEPAAASTVAEPTLNAAKDRITDQAIRADQATYTATQARIRALNETGIPVADYNLSKAQCWLDVSLHEYTRNDRSAFPQESLNQAHGILSALEQNSTPNPAEQTPLLNNADKLREDLWAKAGTLMQAPGKTCYAQKVACAEVELVHAGNEQKQQGWRHAKPYVQIAEDLLAEADAIGDSCLPPPPAPVMAEPVVAPVPTIEQVSIAADALFKFNKSSGDDLLPAGKKTLDEIATKINDGYVVIDSIKLTGYTDRLGSESYNQKLSERRAQTVKQYLQSKGFNHVIETFGKGEADQVAECGTSTKVTKALTECLQPNRRVVVEVKGEKKGSAQ